MQSTNRENAMKILATMFEAEMTFMHSDSNDMSKIKEIFHSDVVIHEPESLPYKGDWKGHDSIARLFKAMHEVWSEVKVEGINATMDYDTIFMCCTMVTIARNSSREVRQPFAQLLKLRDGLVVEGTPFYHDTEALNLAIKAQ